MHFYPDGWCHEASRFKIVAGDTAITVERNVNGNAYEVWCCGIGHTFNGTAQALYHVKQMLRVAANCGDR